MLLKESSEGSHRAEITGDTPQINAVTTKLMPAGSLSGAELVHYLHFKRDKVAPFTGQVHFHVSSANLLLCRAALKQTRVSVDKEMCVTFV